MHGENPAVVTPDSVHGAEMKSAGVCRDITGENQVRTTGMTTGSSEMTEDGSSNYREEKRKGSENAVDKSNRACADSTAKTNVPSPPPPALSDSGLEIEACSGADLADVVGSDTTGAVGIQDKAGSI